MYDIHYGKDRPDPFEISQSVTSYLRRAMSLQDMIFCEKASHIGRFRSKRQIKTRNAQHPGMMCFQFGEFSV